MLCSKATPASGTYDVGPIAANKQPCRLCYYDSDDTVPIFSETGLAADYVGKIARHLYLRVRSGDHLPQVVCWMCTQNLTQFDQFYAKINHIQRTRLKDEYEDLVIYEGRHGVVAKTTAPTLTTPSAVSVETLVVTTKLVEQPAKTDDVLPKSEELLPIASLTSNTKRATRTSLRRCEPVAKAKMSRKSETNDIEDVENINQQCDEDDCNDYVLHDMRNKSRGRGRPSRRIRHTEAVKLDQSIEDDADDDAPLAQLIDKAESKPQKTARMIETANDTANGRPKRGRGRPPKVESLPPVKKIKPTDESSLSKQLDEANDSDSEGESDDDFPHLADEPAAKRPTGEADISDVENDDTFNNGCILDENGDINWAAMMARHMFPRELLRDGLLLYKGERLMQIINKFYNLSCEQCPPTLALIGPHAAEERLQQPRFRTLRSLLAHYSTEHAQRGHVRCCDVTLSRYPAIIMHMARHLQPEAFRCDTCDYVVTRPRFLESHRQTHLPDAQKPFGCAHCDRRFCWKRALKLHERTHTVNAEERRRFVCQDCGKTYETSGGLCAHRKWSHGGYKQELGVCHICAKSFATRAGLNEHMELHRPRERTQVQCTVCAKWLMNQRCLKSHMMLHTTAELHCDQCAYTTKKPVLMRRHMVNRHTEAKPFACALCDKRFKLKRPLTVHMAEAHAAAGTKRKFECPFCSQQFNSSTNFYTHRKNRHPAELAAMQAKEAETRRMRRIQAGVEPLATGERDIGSAEEEDRDGGDDDDDIAEEDNEIVFELSDLDGEPVLVKLSANDEEVEDETPSGDEYGGTMIELIETADEPDAS